MMLDGFRKATRNHMAGMNSGGSGGGGGRRPGVSSSQHAAVNNHDKLVSRKLFAAFTKNQPTAQQQGRLVKKSAAECWNDATALLKNKPDNFFGEEAQTMERSKEAELLFSSCLTPELSTTASSSSSSRGGQGSNNPMTFRATKKLLAKQGFFMGPNMDTGNSRLVHLVGLNLPPRPSSSAVFYNDTLTKDSSWDLWLRGKVIGKQTNNDTNV
jgi:hypothetical protein